MIRSARISRLARKGGLAMRLTLAGLLGWSLFLVGAGAGITRLVVPEKSGVKGASSPEESLASQFSTRANLREGPWGELETLDIDLDQPLEYVAFEDTSCRVPVWRFPNTAPSEVRALMTGCGMRDSQVEAALSGSRLMYDGTTTTVSPGEDLVMSLSTETRGCFYTLLAKWPENTLMRHPYHFSEVDLEPRMTKAGVDEEVIRRVRSLQYQRGENRYFSDLEVVLGHISSEDGRLALLKALSHQTATLVNLRLRPGCDIDKVLGYWSGVPGVRAKDLRPLLESIRDTPGGGSLNLIYLLPPFARSRLFTFPLPDGEGEVRGDCHWSALNFFNDPPDDRLKDIEYASALVREAYYPIGRPSRCGDLVFLLDETGGVIHSAVFLADDLVFTKNGVNFGQPWILMRLNRLLQVYTFSSEPKAVYYRRKQS